MKKINKSILVALLAFVMCGCSCSNKSCECPSDQGNASSTEYTQIVNDYTSVYEETVESVVMVRIQRKSNGEIIATGSGVVFFEEGDKAYVLTNAHVVKNMTSDYEIEVIFSNNKGVESGESEIAVLKGKDYKEDVAVLSINKSSKYKVAVIGDSDSIERGDFVYTIGSPYQIFNHTTAGTISSFNYPVSIDNSNVGVNTTVYAILTDAPINQGNSGGALFNANGELIGITTFKYDKMDGMYGVLPINYFIKVAKHVMVYSSDYDRPSLNLTLLSINEMGVLKEDYGISSSLMSGVYVQSSLEGDIATGSVITKVNGKKVVSVEDFMSTLLKYDVGDSLTLTIVNKSDGLNERTVTVELHS